MENNNRSSHGRGMIWPDQQNPSEAIYWTPLFVSAVRFLSRKILACEKLGRAFSAFCLKNWATRKADAHAKSSLKLACDKN